MAHKDFSKHIIPYKDPNLAQKIAKKVRIKRRDIEKAWRKKYQKTPSINWLW